MEDLKVTIHDRVDENIANVLVPNCIYRCGCPELNGCRFFKDFLLLYDDQPIYDIQTRYDIYNKRFYDKHKGN